MRLNWGMIGGGEGSSDRRHAPHCCRARRVISSWWPGALDIESARARDYGMRLGIAGDRAYGRLASDARGGKVTTRPTRAGHSRDAQRISLRNHTRLPRAGFDRSVREAAEPRQLAEAREIVRIARTRDRICAVNYGYSRLCARAPRARAMVARGDLGSHSCVVAESHTVITPMRPMRTTRAYAGATIRSLPAFHRSSRIAGIHALHMACYINRTEVRFAIGRFGTTVPSRD